MAVPHPFANLHPYIVAQSNPNPRAVDRRHKSEPTKTPPSTQALVGLYVYIHAVSL